VNTGPIRDTPTAGARSIAILTGAPSTSQSTNLSPIDFALSTNCFPAPLSRTRVNASSKNSSTQSASQPPSRSVASRDVPLTPFGAFKVPSR
jgi:hypothetical protein